MLCVLFVGGVPVAEVLRARRFPLLRSDECLVEYLLGIHLDQSTIAVVSDSSSVVCFCNEVLDGLPWKRRALVVGLGGLAVLKTTHVYRKQVLAHRVVRVIERVRHVPTQCLELLSLDQYRVEPTQSINYFSEVFVLIDILEVAHVVE